STLVFRVALMVFEAAAALKAPPEPETTLWPPAALRASPRAVMLMLLASRSTLPATSAMTVLLMVLLPQAPLMPTREAWTESTLVAMLLTCVAFRSRVATRTAAVLPSVALTVLESLLAAVDADPAMTPPLPASERELLVTLPSAEMVRLRLLAEPLILPAKLADVVPTDFAEDTLAPSATR